jgi:hypothetical protein
LTSEHVNNFKKNDKIYKTKRASFSFHHKILTEFKKKTTPITEKNDLLALNKKKQKIIFTIKRCEIDYKYELK